MKGNTSRIGALALAIVFVFTACSGYAPPSVTTPDVVLTMPGGEVVDAPGTDHSARARAGGAIGSARSKVGTGGPVDAANAVRVGPGRTPTHAKGGSRDVGAWPSADLFTESEDRTGLSDDQMTLCVHAPLVFGPALGFDAQDFSIYWDMVTEQYGGIHGRKVQVHAENDMNRPVEAVKAAEACRALDPFLLISAGAATTPAVREWAERRRMFYIPGAATERGTAHLRYSFSRGPSLERLCRVLARRVLRRYAGRDIAVVYRDNSSWVGGRDAFKSVLAGAGIRVVADIPLPDGYAFRDQIDALKDAGADVVLFHHDPVAWIAMMRQAQAQDYRPQWMSWSALALTGRAGAGVANGAEGTSPVVPFTEDASVPWAAEVDRMTDAYRRYHHDPQRPNDISWLFWIFFKDLHRMLVDCGPDCTRNKLAGMWLGGYVGGTRWGCRPGADLGRWAGFRANVVRLSNDPDPVWELQDRCRSGL